MLFVFFLSRQWIFSIYNYEMIHYRLHLLYYIQCILSRASTQDSKVIAITVKNILFILGVYLFILIDFSSKAFMLRTLIFGSLHPITKQLIILPLI